MSYPPLQPDTYPIAGRPVRMAMDSMPWRDPGGRDADPSDPAAALMGLFDTLFGSAHPRRQDVEQLLNDCVGEAADDDMTDEERKEEVEAQRAERKAGMSAQDRKLAKDARMVVRQAQRAHDGTPAGRGRAAALARKIAADSALTTRFPGLHRIGGGY